MWRASDPLGPYRALVARHQSLVEPRLLRLRQRVDEALSELRRLEQENLEQQRRELEALAARLSEDAGALVSSPDLPAFLARLGRERDASGELVAPLPGVEPRLYSLCSRPERLSLSGLEQREVSVLDDELDYRSLRARVQVCFGAVCCEVTVERARRYPDGDEVELSLYTQYEEAFFALGAALLPLGLGEAERRALAAELAALALFALPLLGMSPITARFTYP